MSGTVLVVAFDGMDYDLVKEFDLETIPQKEFGKIDNTKGISSRMTGELFVSFITGETWKEHGVKGLNKTSIRPEWLSKLDELVSGTYIGRKTSDFRETVYETFRSIEYVNRMWMKGDYDEETIFDKTVSKPLHVPGWNPNPAVFIGVPHELVGSGFSIEEAVAALHRNTEQRLRDLEDVSHDFWEFTMLHIHEPDGSQDICYDNLEEEYKRLDTIAENILDKYSDNYDMIVFMSDHGLPEESQHNENAFYSSNIELFGDKTPHITDFHDKILGFVKGE